MPDLVQVWLTRDNIRAILTCINTEINKSADETDETLYILSEKFIQLLENKNEKTK